MKRNNFIERSLVGTLGFLKESVFSDEDAARRAFMQGLDPRCKLAAILMLLLAVLFSRNIYFLVGMYALCLLLVVSSSIRLGFFLKRTWVFIPLFSLFIAVPAIFEVFTPGQAVARFHLFGLSLVITKQGLMSAGFFFIRVLTSVSLCVLLVLTTRHYALLKALRFFKIPQVFVMTAGMCYRYIYLFIEIIENTYLAIKSRVGTVPSAKKGQMVVAWNIGGLWQRSYALHNQVYSAMVSRGYTGEPRDMNEFHAGGIDLLWLGMAFLILGLSLWQTHYLN